MFYVDNYYQLVFKVQIFKLRFITIKVHLKFRTDLTEILLDC